GWDLPRSDAEAYMRQHGGWGYDVRWIGKAGAAEREPSLLDPPDWALHVPAEGAVEPAPAATALLSDAARYGAEVRRGVSAVRLEREGDRIVGARTETDMLPARDVVVAAGTATPKLAATAGVAVELDAPPGLIVHSRPHRRLLN